MKRRAVEMGMAEGMRGVAENILHSYDARVRSLDALVSDTRKTLKGFAQERRKMSREQVKDLTDFVEVMSSSVEGMLKGFQRNHRKMSHEQSRNLAMFVKNLSMDVGSTLRGFEKQRGEMSQELRDRLDREVGDIQARVRERLKELDKGHAEMSNSLRKSLTEYTDDMVRGVGKLLNEYNTDMKKAQSVWSAMSRTLSKASAGGAAEPAKVKPHPVVEMSEEIKTREAPSREMNLEKKMLKFIAAHPEGVRVSDMEKSLDAGRSRLGAIARTLQEKGKVRKEENRYFPL